MPACARDGTLHHDHCPLKRFPPKKRGVSLRHHRFARALLLQLYSVAGIIRLEDRCGRVNSRGHIQHVSPSFRWLGHELLQRMLRILSCICSSVQSTSASAGHFLSSAAAPKKTSVLVAGYCDMFTEDPHTMQIGTGNARQCCERVLSRHVGSITVFTPLFSLWRRFMQFWNFSPSPAFSTSSRTELLRNSAMVLV